MCECTCAAEFSISHNFFPIQNRLWINCLYKLKVKLFFLLLSIAFEPRTSYLSLNIELLVSVCILPYSDTNEMAWERTYGSNFWVNLCHTSVPLLSEESLTSVIFSLFCKIMINNTHEYCLRISDEVLAAALRY